MLEALIGAQTVIFMVMIGALILLNYQASKIRQHLSVIAEAYSYDVSESPTHAESAPEYSTDSTETDSEAELAFQEDMDRRYEEYQNRNVEMKADLAKQQPPRRPTGVEADILHPMIENLPHDSIIEYQPTPPQEIAQ